jgi:hypothetical protein
MKGMLVVGALAGLLLGACTPVTRTTTSSPPPAAASPSTAPSPAEPTTSAAAAECVEQAGAAVDARAVVGHLLKAFGAAAEDRDVAAFASGLRAAADDAVAMREHLGNAPALYEETGAAARALRRAATAVTDGDYDEALIALEGIQPLVEEITTGIPGYADCP